MQMDHHWSVGDGLGGSVLVPSENRGLHHGLVFFRSFGMTHSFLVCFRQAWFFFTHFGIFPPILVFCQNVWYSINVHALVCFCFAGKRTKCDTSPPKHPHTPLSDRNEWSLLFIYRAGKTSSGAGAHHQRTNEAKSTRPVPSGSSSSSATRTSSAV